MRLLWISLVMFALITTPYVLASTVFSSPHITDDSFVGEEITIFIQSIPNAENKTLRYKMPGSALWNQTSINQGELEYVTLGPVPHQGILEYYFVDEEIADSRFPAEGAFRTYVNEEPILYDQYINFATNDTQSPNFCRPLQGEYTCVVEFYQAAEIARFAQLYQRTENTTYKDIRDALLAANWTESNKQCDPNELDFDCVSRNINAITYFGSQQQANIISSLWKTYAITRNQSIQELAANYTRGSAEDCDVWSGDFRCDREVDQGMMIYAYATAYKHTANSTYLDVMYSLIQEADLDSYQFTTARGLSLAAMLTANDTLEELAVLHAQGLRDNCIESSCSVFDYANNIILASEMITQLTHTDPIEVNQTIQEIPYWAYRMIIETAHQQPSGACSAQQEDYTCANPGDQALMIDAYDTLAHNTLSTQQLLYQPRRLTEYTNQVNTSLLFSVKKAGVFENLTLQYRDKTLQQNFNSSPVQDGFSQIPSSFIQDNMIIEYYYNHSQGRYPEQGNLYTVIPLEFTQLEERVDNLIVADPLRFCEPNNGTYSCRYEYMQGIYAHALYYSEDVYAQTLASELLEAEIDISGSTPQTKFYSTCDPYIDDYTCLSINPQFISDPRAQSSSYRSASLIMSRVQGYINTANTRLLDEALTLARTPWQDCNIYQGEYNCQDAQSQARAIQALYMLEQVMLTNEFSNHLDSLINESLLMPVGDELAVTYSTIRPKKGSGDHDTALQEFLNTSAHECTTDFACTPTQLYLRTQTIWNAYILYEIPEYFETGSLLLLARPADSDGYCDYNNPEVAFSTQRYSCALPQEQAIILQAATTARNNYLSSDPPELNLTLNSEPVVSLHQETTVTCDIRNVGTTSVNEASVSLSTNQEITNLALGGNATASINGLVVEISDFSESEVINITYTLNATAGGRNTITCSLLQDSISNQITVTDIGEIINAQVIDTPNQFNNFTLHLLVENIRDFSLENVTVIFDSEHNYSIINASTNWLDTSNNASTEVLGASQNASFLLEFENIFDSIRNITLTSSSAFEGFSNQTLQYSVVDSNFTYVKSHVSSTRIFDKETISFEIINDKPVALQDVNISIQTDNNSVIISTNNSLPAVHKNSSSITIPSINLNDSKQITFDIQTLANNTNTTINYTIFSPTGILRSHNFSIDLTTDIISLQTPSQVVAEYEQFNATTTITNTALENQTNITAFFNTSSGLEIIGFYLPRETITNTTQLNINQTLLDGNISEQARINVTSQAGKVNITNKSFEVILDTPNNITNLTILTQYESTQELEILYNQQSCILNQTNTSCSFTYNQSINSFEYLQSNASQTNISYITITAKKITEKLLASNVSEQVTLFEIAANKSQDIITTLLYNTSAPTTSMSIQAHSNELGEASETVIFSKQAQPPSSDSTGGSGGGSATGGGVSTIDLELVKYDIDLVLEQMLILVPQQHNISEEFYTTFNTEEFNRTKMQEALDCLQATRTLIPQNNNTYVVEIQVNNNCNQTIQIHVFEQIAPLYQPEELVISPEPVQRYEDIMYFVINVSKKSVISYYTQNELPTRVLAKLPDQYNHESASILSMHQTYTSAVNQTLTEQQTEETASSNHEAGLWDQLVFIATQTKAPYLFAILLFMLYFTHRIIQFKRQGNPIRILAWAVSRKRKIKKKLTKKRHYARRGIGAQEDALLMLSLRIDYIKQLIEQGNLEEAKQEYAIAHEEYLRDKELMEGHDKIAIVSHELKNIHARIQGVSHNQTEKSKNKSKNKKVTRKVKEENQSDNQAQKIGEEEVDEQDQKEKDVFVWLIGAKQKIEQESFTEAETILKKILKAVDEIDELEKPALKEYFVNELELVQQDMEKKKENSWKYFAKTKWKSIKERFRRDDTVI